MKDEKRCRDLMRAETDSQVRTPTWQLDSAARRVAGQYMSDTDRGF